MAALVVTLGEARKRANKIVDEIVPRGLLALPADRELRHRIQMAIYEAFTEGRQ